MPPKLWELDGRKEKADAAKAERLKKEAEEKEAKKKG